MAMQTSSLLGDAFDQEITDFNEGNAGAPYSPQILSDDVLSYFQVINRMQPPEFPAQAIVEYQGKWDAFLAAHDCEDRGYNYNEALPEAVVNYIQHLSDWGLVPLGIRDALGIYNPESLAGKSRDALYVLQDYLQEKPVDVSNQEDDPSDQVTVESLAGGFYYAPSETVKDELVGLMDTDIEFPREVLTFLSNLKRNPEACPSDKTVRFLVTGDMQSEAFLPDVFEFRLGSEFACVPDEPTTRDYE